MASIDLGAPATVTWPAAPDTGPYALAVKKPDGTTLAPAPTVDGYKESTSASFLPTMAGRYLLSWSANGASAYTDVLDVWPADPRFLIPLEEATTGLRFAPNVDPAKSSDLRLYLAAATPVIEDITGALLPETRTHSSWGGSRSVVLPHLPSQILSITLDGVPVTAYVPDLASGIVYSGSRQAVTAFGIGDLVITYKTGAAEIPPNVRLAARELVRHWWQIGMQASGGGARGSQPDSEVFTPSGFAVPRRVMELCTPHQQVGGFA
jgi:hypothetical protein